jgi:hypothetical protein
MTLSQFELKKCEKSLSDFLERRRPPVHIRPELDIAYRISGQSVEIFEVRPDWQDPTQKMESPVAKATYVRTKNRWNVYWMRQDLKWHGYEPNPEVRTLEAFLHVVDRDEYCCFFG